MKEVEKHKEEVLTDGLAGDLGVLHTLEVKDNSILVFQMARPTRMLSASYIEGVMRSVQSMIPEQKIMYIGSDINIFEIAGEDLVMLKMQGRL